MATVEAQRLGFWLLLWLGVWPSEALRHNRASMNDDLLLPYPEGHGSAHSHRHIRDCQAVVHGNVTYETWQSSRRLGEPESSVFITDVGPKRWTYGHMTTVPDPLRTLSVMEPGGPGGCGFNHRAPVEETVGAAGCLFSQNAGFFNTSSGRCLGNIVSDGRLVQDSGGVQNAQFGIRRDGTLVFGYLSEEDVLDQVNPFVQLVSGVVWLLRKGQVYINQSLQAECSKMQETGELRYFADVVTGRTAVGHDAHGRVVLFHLDGQTGVRGMSLWEVADFLKRNGVVNAINLDGGGSSTFVVNGSLASYPSDHCISEGKWRCPRAVSTVLCVHPPRCQPADCGGHGACLRGVCQCQGGWRGPGCGSLVCQPPACGAHGVCTSGGCVCDAGWRGHNCSEECMEGSYGDGCNHTCACTNGATCDPVHGRCACGPGFHGDLCQQECPLGFYGVSCSEECHCEDLCPSQPRFPNPYLSEQAWLMVSIALSSLLLASLVCHVMRGCPASLSSGQRGRLSHRHDYAFVPLTDLNGSTAGAKVSRPGGAGGGPDDSDSQDELWSPRFSGS
ncbi:hypothetical protein NHX12_001173 [Muraenolepis orangiensis]|uniref:EGF-like domain-containing protein n=1 Tax=Muraenolepis orangiensis TaxID=630683 RepID=A0A9Q0IHX2_9TELE|nr:hypothetical protein NHX12_001173 [Muraenolepis orangiensis]